ncbi:DMT family transporter [Bifidobacterium sp. CP2]|uniref:DMT family transporter n=1 Tax=Bifidobacterium sp. CP2 TaxID=2809025 RepID=UPI001BDD0309|nr:DMT family transporter [Bifidobacterium sp. CP2]MBT1182232.1 DMT family transporter [Bifidobacterium sp. CP2]
MLCLLTAALIWGFSFVSQVQGMDSMTPLFFNAVRFTLGALSLIPVLLVSHARHASGGASGASVSDSSDAADDPTERLTLTALVSGRLAHPMRAALASPVIVGAICGTVLFVASTLQQYGILYGRSAGRAGFLTALYIVIVPLLGRVFLHRHVNVMVAVSVLVAVAGFYCLCITDGFGSMTLADVLLLFTALMFAGHILVIDTLGGMVDALKLSFVQFVTAALLSWAGSLIEGSVDPAGAARGWVAVVYAGVGSVGVAYTMQALGQRWVPPTRASLIMSLESFFSAVGGALLLGEVMTPRGYLGCALIFVGTLLAQMPARLPAWLIRSASGSGRPAALR